MPTAVEERLREAANKYARRGKLKKSKKYGSIQKAKDAFVYGTMTRMQEKGSIPPWRTLKR